MKRAIARKWAKALDSGEYSQSYHALRSADGFCCLGVLCNLHAQAHPEIAARQVFDDSYLGSTTALPQEVVEWSGMASDEGYINRDFCLIDLNDDGQVTFPEIAKVIRKYWKEL